MTDPRPASGADARARTCYLCGAQGLQQLTEVEGYSIVYCRRCGLGETLLQAGGAREPAAAYDRSYLESQWTGADPSPEQIERAVRAESARVRRVGRAAPGKHLLEIGSGHGYFLEAARRRGLEVRGIDVSSAAVEFCRSRFRLSVENVSAEDATVSDGSLDIVVAWHVLEHLADPLAVLRRARAWLRPGGIIALEVPDYRSYDARVQGRAWQGWQPRYHRWHFTPRALALVLEAAGFAVEQAWHPPSRVARERLKRIPVVGLLRPVLSRFYTGTGAAAIARAAAPGPPPRSPAAR